MIIYEQEVPKDNADDVVLVRKKYFNTGDSVKVNDEVVDLETSKTAIILTSEQEGYIEFLCKPGDKVSVGEVVFRIHDAKDFEHKVEFSDNLSLQSKASSSGFKLSKAAQRFVDEHDVDISSLGLSGLVSLKMIQLASGNLIKDEPHLAERGNDATSPLASEIVSFSKSNEIKALTSVNQSGLVSTIAVKVKVSPFDDYFKKGILREVVFEASRLLKGYPLLNAFYSEGRIHLHENVNIGFAVDIDDGLKVLVVKDANKESFLEISTEMDNLISKYLEKELSVSDLTQGTFTITDLSTFGVSSFVPLINADQSAMLGISAFEESSNTIELSLSFDHRVTEGRYVANFLTDLKGRLEALITKSEINNIKCCQCLKSLSEDKTMNGIGFYRLVRHDGSESLICQVCAAGW